MDEVTWSMDVNDPDSMHLFRFGVWKDFSLKFANLLILFFFLKKRNLQLSIFYFKLIKEQTFLNTYEYKPITEELISTIY